MSGAEVMAVVACVAAVVSAYHDGSKMASTIKKKWQNRKRRLSELERSLDRGEREVQNHYNLNVAHFGTQYQQGDETAREQMKDIIIHLQGVLLAHLGDAVKRNVTVDIAFLQDTSDVSRIRTIQVLHDLYQRLAQAGPIPIPMNHMQDQTYRLARSLDTLWPRDRTWGPRSSDGDIVPEGNMQGSTSRGKRASFTSGLSGIFSSRLQRRDPQALLPALQSFAEFPARLANPETASLIDDHTPDSDPDSTVVQPTEMSVAQGILDVELGFNPWDDGTVSRPMLTLAANPPPSVLSSDSANSNPSSPCSVSVSPPVEYLWLPNADNQYAGFCKGAWKLHSGLREAFRVHKEPGAGYYTQMSWLRCSKCYYEAPVAPGSSAHAPRFHDALRWDRSTGIRYRVVFLAKWHVSCKRNASLDVPNGTWGTFGCIFCSVAHKTPAPTFGPLEVFLAHLAAEHRDLDAGRTALLDRTRCVVGRVATAREDFDINIPPL
ncbi:hypothetical protein N7474_002224 [Penicillium riverlandense]|uniref:uncharacterized protein n=1 Tax=Penicillium riverlandense TaxID=1903569 RepID=UPI002548D1F5|nr:uncharacterized protein N7474_002224 [Penicillium riverlandense]KAJ5833913.1 hypothetical protein N7474_002224 [Penicillium riverlandense]